MAAKMREPLFVERAGDPGKGEFALLAPWGAATEEKVRKLKFGKVVQIRWEQPRNAKQLALLWVVAKIVADNSEEYADAAHVVKQLKFSTGHTVVERYKIPVLGWIERTMPASIAYESMSQADFAEWFNRALDVIVNDMLPGVSRETIRKEVCDALGVKYWPKGVA